MNFTFLLSPTGIFCVMNLVIGTIYITSQLKHQNKASRPPHDHLSGHAPPYLARPPSLLERVRSINFSTYRPHDDEDAVNSAPELARPPSFLERVKSINFSSYSPSEDTQDAVDSSPQLSRPPSFLERVKSINFSSYSPNEDTTQDAVNTSPELSRQPSFLERVKSFKFSSVHHAAVDRHEVEEMPDVYVDEQSAPAKMKKSSSEKAMSVAGQEEAETTLKQRSGSMTARAAPATAEEDDGVDEKANDFINRFRQQLKLQRMDSIMRYRDMLNRGASR